MAQYSMKTLRLRQARARHHLVGNKKLGGSSSQLLVPTASNAGNSASGSDRFVLLYHFTGWPTPDKNPLPLLSFVRRSSEANRETNAPIVVHEG